MLPDSCGRVSPLQSRSFDATPALCCPEPHRVDIHGNGSTAMVCAVGRKLQFLDSAGVQGSALLLGDPAALATFHLTDSTPRVPAVAVASGVHVYIYRNMRPYFRFVVPEVPLEPTEAKLWDALREGGLAPDTLPQQLAELREASKVRLSTLGAQLVSAHAAGRASEVQDLLAQGRQRKPQQGTAICAMSMLHRQDVTTSLVGQLVLGTESGEVLVLGPGAQTVALRVQLPSSMVAASIATFGAFDIEYRIAVATREGSVCIIRNGSLVHTLHVQQPVLGVAVHSAMTAVLTACGHITAYNARGNLLWRIKPHSPPTCLITLPITSSRSSTLLAAGCADSNVLVFSDHGTLLMDWLVQEKEGIDQFRAMLAKATERDSTQSTAAFGAGAAGADVSTPGAMAAAVASASPIRRAAGPVVGGPAGQRMRITMTDGRAVTKPNIAAMMADSSPEAAIAAAANDPIQALRWGSFGRQDQALVAVHASGAMSVRVLQRGADFAAASADTGPPPEQSIPLPVPQKTRTWLALAEREREQGSRIHNQLQRDLLKLKLHTLKQYNTAVGEGRSAQSVAVAEPSHGHHSPKAAAGQPVGSRPQVALTTELQGLGPRWTLAVSVRNTGASSIPALTVALAQRGASSAVPAPYTIARASAQIQALPAPGLRTVCFSIEQACAEGAAEWPAPGTLQVYLLDNASASQVPLASCAITMPPPALLEL